MHVVRSSKRILNCLLGKLGFQIVRKESVFRKETTRQGPFPEGANKYLREDNPRLLELRHSYELLNHPALERSLWTQKKISTDLNLLYFRSDNMYVWQHRDNNQEINYAISLNYIKSIDKLNLLEILKEDGFFGASTFIIDNKVVSRDLLDSMNEIYFLERNLNISGWSSLNILDIGAGYGRLAHRMSCALSNLKGIYCVDAIPESTFLCEYYLVFRKAKHAHAVPLYEIENIMAENQIDIAINVCSFSEIPHSSIKWWIELLQKHKVNYLMIVPDGGLPLVSHQKDGTKLDFEKVIYQAGYKLKIKEDKYLASSVQKYGISPSHHYLFELDI